MRAKRKRVRIIGRKQSQRRVVVPQPQKIQIHLRIGLAQERRQRNHIINTGEIRIVILFIESLIVHDHRPHPEQIQRLPRQSDRSAHAIKGSPHIRPIRRPDQPLRAVSQVLPPRANHRAVLIVIKPETEFPKRLLNIGLISIDRPRPSIAVFNQCALALHEQAEIVPQVQIGMRQQTQQVITVAVLRPGPEIVVVDIAFASA